MRFLWDEIKNRANQRKHGLSFEQASALFASVRDYLEIFDDAHSGDEDRFIALGPIESGVIVVVFVEPDERSVRIISARKATSREREMFAASMKGRQI